MKIGRISVRSGIGLLVLALIVTTGCSQVEWQHDLNKGLQRASVTGRRALVEFYSPFNKECQKMQNEVFSDPEVQKVMGRFVLIRVNKALNKQAADRFNAVVLPTYVVLRPGRNGMEVVGQRTGSMDKETFRLFLIKNSLY
jgi:thiol:disulfide interchange protein DsbD